MQAIDLEANLEGNVKAVLFPGTAFAVFGQDRPNREKSLQITAVFSIMENCVCYCKISCKEREP